MLQIINDVPNNAVAAKAKSTIKKDNYDSLLMPGLNA